MGFQQEEGQTGPGGGGRSREKRWQVGGIPVQKIPFPDWYSRRFGSLVRLLNDRLKSVWGFRKNAGQVVDKEAVGNGGEQGAFRFAFSPAFFRDLLSSVSSSVHPAERSVKVWVRFHQRTKASWIRGSLLGPRFLRCG